jgi:hypothetical protein
MSITVTSVPGRNGSNFDPQSNTRQVRSTVIFFGDSVTFYAYYSFNNRLQWAFGVSSCTATEAGNPYTLVPGATLGTTVTLSLTNPSESSLSPSTADHGPPGHGHGSNGQINVGNGDPGGGPK